MKARKLISSLTAVLLIFNQIGTAAVSVPHIPTTEVKVPSAFQLTLPADLGTVQNLISGSGPTLIHIQNAHGNYEAQKKIQAILHYLKDNYGIKVLFLEGSASKLNPDLLRFFPQRMDLTMKMADKLAKKALVKGSELFLLQEPETLGYGIEDLNVYVANGKAFQGVLAQREKTASFLEDMRLQIERLASPYLNKDLRSFLKRLDDFETKKLIDFPEWLAYLRERGKVILDIDLLDPRYQIDWPMLLRIYKLKEFESKINQTAYLKEKELFLKAIRNIPKDTYQQIEKLLSSSLSENQLSDPETSLLFEKMVSSLPVSFNFKAYPNVKYFIAHLILQSEIKGDRLFEEMNALTDKLSLKLAHTEEEKKLLDLFKDYRLLQRLFALELTAEDYEMLLKRGDAISPGKLSARFLELNKSKRVRNGQFQHVEEIESLFKKSLEFYRLAKERDHLMLKNIESRLTETSQNKVAVITGGFHSNPFKDYFQAKGYNYALITPKISNDSGRDSYRESAFHKGLNFSTSTWEDPFLTDPHLIVPPKLAWEINELKTEVAKRSEVRSNEVNPIDELPEGLAQTVLKRFKDWDPKRYSQLIKKITYEGKPQFLWAEDMPKAVGIYSMQIEGVGTTTGFVINQKFRKAIEKAAQDGRGLKNAVTNTLYLWFIREAASLEARSSNETITPDLHAELLGSLAQANAYYASESAVKDIEKLREMMNRLDTVQKHRKPRFLSLIKIFDQFGPKTIYTEKGLNALLDQIFDDPRYSKEYKREQALEIIAKILKEKSEGPAIAAKAKSARPAVQFMPRNQEETFNKLSSNKSPRLGRLNTITNKIDPRKVETSGKKIKMTFMDAVPGKYEYELELEYAPTDDRIQNIRILREKVADPDDNGTEIARMPLPNWPAHALLDVGISSGLEKLIVIVSDDARKELDALVSRKGLGPSHLRQRQRGLQWEIISQTEAEDRYEELKDIFHYEPTTDLRKQLLEAIALDDFEKAKQVIEQISIPKALQDIDGLFKKLSMQEVTKLEEIAEGDIFFDVSSLKLYRVTKTTKGRGGDFVSMDGLVNVRGTTNFNMPGSSHVVRRLTTAEELGEIRKTGSVHLASEKILEKSELYRKLLESLAKGDWKSVDEFFLAHRHDEQGRLLLEELQRAGRKVPDPARQLSDGDYVIMRDPRTGLVPLWGFVRANPQHYLVEGHEVLRLASPKAIEEARQQIDAKSADELLSTLSYSYGSVGKTFEPVLRELVSFITEARKNQILDSANIDQLVRKAYQGDTDSGAYFGYFVTGMIGKAKKLGIPVPLAFIEFFEALSKADELQEKFQMEKIDVSIRKAAEEVRQAASPRSEMRSGEINPVDKEERIREAGRSEVRSQITPIDEMMESLATAELLIFQGLHNLAYDKVIQKIIFESKPQLLWAENMPKPTGIYTMEIEMGTERKRVAGIVADKKLHGLEKIYQTGNETAKDAVKIFLFLMLVREVAALDTRGGDETITPHLESELKGRLAAAEQYYRLLKDPELLRITGASPQSEQEVKKLAAELDGMEPHNAPSFLTELETFDRFNVQTMYSQEGLAALGDLILANPQYGKKYTKEDVSDTAAKILKEKNAELIKAPKSKSPALAVLLVARNQEELFNHLKDSIRSPRLQWGRGADQVHPDWHQPIKQKNHKIEVAFVDPRHGHYQWVISLEYDPKGKVIKRIGFASQDLNDLDDQLQEKFSLSGGYEFKDVGIASDLEKMTIVVPDSEFQRYQELNSGQTKFEYTSYGIKFEIISESQAVQRCEELKEILHFEPMVSNLRQQLLELLAQNNLEKARQLLNPLRDPSGRLPDSILEQIGKRVEGWGDYSEGDFIFFPDRHGQNVQTDSDSIFSPDEKQREMGWIDETTSGPYFFLNTGSKETIHVDPTHTEIYRFATAKELEAIRQRLEKIDEIRQRIETLEGVLEVARERAEEEYQINESLPDDKKLTSFPLSDRYRELFEQKRVLEKQLAEAQGRSEMRSNEINPVDEISESLIGPALQKLEKWDDEAYKALLQIITYEGKPQLLWAENMPKSAGIYSMKTEIGNQVVTGFVMNTNLREILEKTAKESAEIKSSVNDLLYLHLVRETEIIRTKNGNETINPDIVSELKGLLAQAKAYYALPKPANPLKALARRLDQMRPDQKPHFEAFIEIFDRFNGETINTEPSLRALIDLIFEYPHYDQKYKTKQAAAEKVIAQIVAKPKSAPPAVRLIPRTKDEFAKTLGLSSKEVFVRDDKVEVHFDSSVRHEKVVIIHEYDPVGLRPKRIYLKIFEGQKWYQNAIVDFFESSHWKVPVRQADWPVNPILTSGISKDLKKMVVVVTDPAFNLLNDEEIMAPGHLKGTADYHFHGIDWEIISGSQAVERYEELKDILHFEPTKLDESMKKKIIELVSNIKTSLENLAYYQQHHPFQPPHDYRDEWPSGFWAERHNRYLDDLDQARKSYDKQQYAARQEAYRIEKNIQATVAELKKLLEESSPSIDMQWEIVQQFADEQTLNVIFGKVRSEMRAGEITPTDEIQEAIAGPALEKLKQQNREVYRDFIRKVTFDGKPQLLWAEGMEKDAQLYSMEVQLEDKRQIITGFVVNIALKDKLTEERLFDLIVVASKEFYKPTSKPAPAMEQGTIKLHQEFIERLATGDWYTVYNFFTAHKNDDQGQKLISYLQESGRKVSDLAELSEEDYVITINPTNNTEINWGYVSWFRERNMNFGDFEVLRLATAEELKDILRMIKFKEEAVAYLQNMTWSTDRYPELQVKAENVKKDPLLNLQWDPDTRTLTMVVMDRIKGIFEDQINTWEREHNRGAPMEWSGGKDIHWKVLSESEWKSQARSEMRSSERPVPSGVPEILISGRVKPGKIENHPAIPSIISYYQSRNNLFKSIATGDVALYEKSLAESATYAEAAQKKIDSNDTLRAIIRHLKGRKPVLSARSPELEVPSSADLKDLPFDPKTIADDLEISRTQEEAFDSQEREIVDTGVDSFLTALGYDADLREDLARKIKLITYPLTLLNMLPKSIRGYEYTPDALRILYSQLELFASAETKTIAGAVIQSPVLEKDITIQILRKENPVFFKAALFHEIIHYLALENFLPFDMKNEIITEGIRGIIYLQEAKLEDLLNDIPSSLADLRKALETIVNRGEGAALKNQRLMTPDEIQKMVNDFLAIETPGLLAIDSINLKDLVERLSGFYLAGYAWGLKKKDSSLNTLKFIVDYGKRHLPRVRNADFTRKLSQRDWSLIQEVLKTLRAVARVTLKDADDRVHFTPRTLRDLKSLDRTRWFYEREDQAMNYVPWDIIEYGPKASIGLTLQEVFRANYSEEGLIEPAYDEIPFRLLYGVAESARVVAQGLSENPGRIEDVEAFYRKKLRIFDLEIEKEKMAERPRFVQYIEGLFYTLALTKDASHPIEDPRITDPKVKAVVEKTFPEILKVLGEEGKTFYQAIRDKVWPEVKTLLEEDKQDAIKDELENEALNKMIEDGEFEVTADETPSMPTPEGAKPEVPPAGEKLKISISAGPTGKPTPMDLSEKAKKKLQEKVEEMLRKMDTAERAEIERKAQEALEKELGKEEGEMSDVTSTPPQMPLRRGERQVPPSVLESQDSSAAMRRNQELRKDLEGLQELTQDIQEQAGEIEKDAQAASQAAESADSKAGTIDRNAGGASTEGEDIASSLKRLVEQIKTLREKSKQFHDKAEGIEEKVTALRHPERSEGSDVTQKQILRQKSPQDDMQARAEQILDLAKEMEEDAAGSDKLANDAAGSGEELKERLAQHPDQVDAIKGRAKAIQEKMARVKEKLDHIQKEAEQASQGASEVQNDAGELEQKAGKPLPEISQDAGKSKQRGGGGSGAHIKVKDKTGTEKAKREEAQGPTAPATPQEVHRYDPKIANLLKEFLEDTEEIDASEKKDESAQAEAIRSYTGLTDQQRVAIERIRGISREYEATLRENILSALQESEMTERKRHQRKGRIDTRRLPLIETGIKDPFELKKEPDEKKLRKVLVLDLSGSMFGDRNNLNLGNVTDAMLQAKNRINNLIKVVILYLQAFREDDQVEQAIVAFALDQKVLLNFGEPITDELIYKIVDYILNHDLGSNNTDLAGLQMAIDILRKRDLETGPQPKIVTIIADGGINYSDAEGIKRILEENKDIAFIPRGIGPQSADVEKAYAPYGKTVPDVADLAMKIGDDLQEQSSALLGNGGRSEMRMIVPALIAPKKFETENFTTLKEGEDTYLVVKGGRYPSFKAKINGQGSNIPDVDLLETETNVKDVVKILKRVQRQYLDRSPLYIEGEAGTAKNRKIYYSGRLLRKNVRFMAMHDDITEDDLVERRGVNERELGKTDWIPSPILEAMLHGDWVIVDEVNKAKPEVLARLNQILQSRRATLHDGTVITAKEGFAVIMTGNPPPSANDAKVYQVNKESAEMLDRYRAMNIGYLPKNEEIQLLHSILMKKRGYAKPEQIPQNERTIIKLLVDAANDIRDRYFGKDPSTTHTVGRGKLIARPLSTRALVNIIERISDFSEESKRMRSLIARFYSYDWEKDEQKRNVEQIINNKFGADEPVALSADDLKGPQYGENAEGKRVLKFAGIEVELGPKAPKDFDEVPLDMRVTWTPTNLQYLRETMMDFKQGNHMLFIGEAGTGKDTLAEYITYLIHGPVVETFGVTRNAMVEDLIAYLGIGEGEKANQDGMILAVGKNETGLVPAYVIRAMREGRPVILDEINKGKPEVFAVLNNILEYGWIDLANGVRVYAKPGFVIIATMNPPGKKVYLGNYQLSGEFIDRFSAYKMDYLKKNEETEILMGFNRYLKTLDPRFHVLKREFIERLVKMVRKLRDKYQEGKLPRPVSMRGSKRVIVTLSEYPEEYKDELEGLIHESFFFHDPAHVEVVTKALKDKDVKLQDLTSIVDFSVETGDADIDKALEALKTSAKDQGRVIQSLVQLDALLKTKKLGRKKSAILTKAKEQFDFIMSSEVPGHPGELIPHLVEHLHSRMDGKELPDLPGFMMEKDMTGKWDLKASKDLGKRTLGKIVGGIFLSDQSEAAKIIEIGGMKFLGLNGGSIPDSTLESTAESLGLQIYGEERIGTKDGGVRFEEYFKAVQELKAAIEKGVPIATIIATPQFKILEQRFDPAFTFIPKLVDIANPKLSPMVVPGKKKAVFSEFDAMAGMDAIGKRALLISMEILWEGNTRISIAKEIKERLENVRSEVRSNEILPTDEISEILTKAALDRVKSWNAELYQKLIEKITFEGKPQILWAEGMEKDAQLYSMEVEVGDKKQIVTGFIINVALKDKLTDEKLFDLIAEASKEFFKSASKSEIAAENLQNELEKLDQRIKELTQALESTNSELEKMPQHGSYLDIYEPLLRSKQQMEQELRDLNEKKESIQKNLQLDLTEITNQWKQKVPQRLHRNFPDLAKVSKEHGNELFWVYEDRGRKGVHMRVIYGGSPKRPIHFYYDSDPGKTDGISESEILDENLYEQYRLQERAIRSLWDQDWLRYDRWKIQKYDQSFISSTAISADGKWVAIGTKKFAEYHSYDYQMSLDLGESGFETNHSELYLYHNETGTFIHRKTDLSDDVKDIRFSSDSKSLTFRQGDRLVEMDIRKSRSELRKVYSRAAISEIMTPAFEITFKELRDRTLPEYLFAQLPTRDLIELLSKLLGETIYSEKAGGASPVIESRLTQTLGKGRIITTILTTKEIDSMPALTSLLTVPTQTKRQLIDYREQVPQKPAELDALILYTAYHPDVAYNLFLVGSPAQMTTFRSELRHYVQTHHGIAIPSNFNIESVETVAALTPRLNQLFDRASKSQIRNAFITENPALAEIGYRPNLLRAIGSRDSVLQNATTLLAGERLLEELSMDMLTRVHRGEDLDRNHISDALIADLRKLTLITSAA